MIEVLESVYFQVLKVIDVESEKIAVTTRKRVAFLYVMTVHRGYMLSVYTL
jgi:hypothetical protein